MSMATSHLSHLRGEGGRPTNSAQEKPGPAAQTAPLFGCAGQGGRFRIFSFIISLYFETCPALSSMHVWLARFACSLHPLHSPSLRGPFICFVVQRIFRNTLPTSVRLAEQHACPFDYHGAGQRGLRKLIPGGGKFDKFGPGSDRL